MPAPWSQPTNVIGDKQRVITAVVSRQSLERTTAVVRAVVPGDFGDDEDNYRPPADLLLVRIRQAVTAWANTTEEGREALLASAYDFNVGDLSVAISPDMCPDAVYPPESLEHYLRAADILALQIETYVSTQGEHVWEFDDWLFNEDELTRSSKH